MALFRFTRTIEGDSRAWPEGREVDWPMSLVRKFRKDYGQDVLVPSGANADWISRVSARRVARHGEKPDRQERLRTSGLLPQEPSEPTAVSAEQVVAEAKGRRRRSEIEVTV